MPPQERNIDTILFSKKLLTPTAEYHELSPINKFKVRTIIRAMIEVQELRIKLGELQKVIISKQKTVTRLANQILGR